MQQRVTSRCAACGNLWTECTAHVVINEQLQRSAISSNNIEIDLTLASNHQFE